MSKALPRPVERLVEAFSRLPGIGPKTASRLTYYLLRAPVEESRELAGALERLRAETVFCSRCYMVTERNRDPCAICTDESRVTGNICVVEEPLDVLAIERTGLYRGRYHVLQGALSPVEGVGPGELRMQELVNRLAEEKIEEVILATNPTFEGEATAMYIKELLAGEGIRLTRLARGLPSGGDLEYADSRTLAQALVGRREL